MNMKEICKMCFKDIFAKINELKDMSVSGIVEELGIDVMFVETIPLDKEAMKIEKTIILRNVLVSCS